MKQDWQELSNEALESFIKQKTRNAVKRNTRKPTSNVKPEAMFYEEGLERIVK